MRKIIFALIIALILLNCSASDKKEPAATQVEVPQIQPEVPFERLRNNPTYESDEDYFRMQINLHYSYYYLTPEGKAKPPAEREADFEKLLAKAKSRYSLTDQQVNTIRNHQLYIGMHRTCVYLAWGIYQGPLGISINEEKSVSANGTNHKITFEASPRRYKTAFTENDVLVSYQE